MRQKKSSKFVWEDPPPPTFFEAISFNLYPHVLISLPSTSVNTRLTTPFTLSTLVIRSLCSQERTLVRSCSNTFLELKCWSPNIGCMIRGKPRDKHPNIEFHLQRVMNAPTNWWEWIRCWGAHVGILWWFQTQKTREQRSDIMMEFSAKFLQKQTTQNCSVSAQKTDNFVFWTWCCSNRILVLQQCRIILCFY